MPASDSASEVTLTAQAAAAQPKKKSRPRHQTLKRVDVKLFGKLGKIWSTMWPASPPTFALSANLRESQSSNSPSSIKVYGKPSKSKIETVQTMLQQEGMTRSMSHEQPRSSNLNKPIKAKYKEVTIFTLHEIAATDALRALVARFDKVSHMGILDTSHSFFLNKHGNSALQFKVRDKVAVVSDDPLCEPGKFDSLLEELYEYRKQFGWSIGFLGLHSNLQNREARRKDWVTMRFGIKRVLNTITN
jgi:Phosphatidylglycerol lysyltransferase, C-terminal